MREAQKETLEYGSLFWWYLAGVAETVESLYLFKTYDFFAMT